MHHAGKSRIAAALAAPRNARPPLRPPQGRRRRTNVRAAAPAACLAHL
jgi:hypothetical protein